MLARATAIEVLRGLFKSVTVEMLKLAERKHSRRQLFRFDAGVNTVQYCCRPFGNKKSGYRNLSPASRKLDRMLR